MLLPEEQRQAFIEDLREEASRARCVQHLNVFGRARLHDSRCAANGNSTSNLITTRLSQLLPSEHGWNDCIAHSVKLAYYQFGRIPPTSTSNSKRFKTPPFFEARPATWQRFDLSRRSLQSCPDAYSW